MDRLKGKNILITGASKGLGRQVALEFAGEGTAGLALVARSSEGLEDIRSLLHGKAPNVKVLAIPANLADPANIERVVALTLNEFGGHIDVVVNNASALGPSPMSYLLDYPVEVFHQVLETNLVAPFLLIKNFLPAMIERGGSIINVTSDAGVTGYPGWGAYGISKFGIEGMSQTWAAELEGSGVRVNWVDPGPMNTEMHRLAEPDEDPNQWADPAQVTGVFVYLASDESKKVNGKRFQAQEQNWRQRIAAKDVGAAD